MKKTSPGEYYHIYNRGMQKQLIFNDDLDRFRLLFNLFTFQSKTKIKTINRKFKQSVQSRTLNISQDLIQSVVKERMVEVVTFCFMPNHFHLIVKEIVDKGVAKYMQRVLTAYTKYFNTRHGNSGHLFQGPYKAVHIENDEQLMYVSAYIHKNPVEVKGVTIENYYWSSYQDYVGDSRWKILMMPEIILGRYSDTRDTYKKFVDSCTAKEYL
ncbi:MAG TPA: transposase [Candidatus Paceibacterota bacterium]